MRTLGGESLAFFFLEYLINYSGGVFCIVKLFLPQFIESLN